MQDEIQKIKFLSGSPYRVQLLKELAGEQLSREELRERCDASRTTVQRNLDALEERDWIQNSNRTYTLTKKGEEVTEQLLELIETVRAVERLQPFLQWMPEDISDLDFQILADATIITVNSGDPYIIQNHYIDRLNEVHQVRALIPTTGVRSWEAAREQVLAGELECEVIVGPDVVEMIKSSPDYKRILEDVLESNRHDVFVIDEQPLCSLALMDEYVLIPIHNEDDLPLALIESDRDDVYEWAEQTYNEYKQQAKPFFKQISL